MNTARFSIPMGSPVKEIIASISTGSMPPEEMLARLDQYDIDWYVTDEGDLLIKYWQVIAEDFMPREQIARIRSGHPTPSGVETLEWLSGHLDELRERYGGQWVGISQNTVVASSSNLHVLLETLHQLGIDGTFITQIPAGRVIWKSVYG